jgi:F420-dependent oxidoreductase-like protein
MISISIMIEGQMGLTWERWQRLVTEVDGLGFAGLFRSDHFTDPEPPNQNSLELVVSLAYAASHSRRIHFGPLVAPVTFRDPVMLARQAAALDDLSGGRMILGLGAGWQEREHHLFGYPLGSTSERMNRFQEALEVTTRLLREDAPTTFEGTYFQIRDGASLQPRPKTSGRPPIMIGGNGPQRTLPLVARYADIWNGVFLDPNSFRERSQRLDGLLHDVGRKPDEVRRTLMRAVEFGQDLDELDRKLHWRHERPETAGKPLEDVLAEMQARGNIVGTAEMIAEQIGKYADAGAEELMLQWLDLDDIDGLRTFARQVLPLL